MWAQRLLNLLWGLALLAAGPAGAATYPSLGWWAVLLAVAGGALGILWGLVYLRGALPAPVVADDVCERVVEVVDELSSAAGITAPRVLVRSRATYASVAWCGETPQLLFPSVWAERLSHAELRAYVGHELAHLVQPELRGANSLASRTSLVTSLGVGLALGSLWAVPQPGQHPAAFVALALEPLALTLLVWAHRLPRRGLLMRLELVADRQAVDWGAPPQLLANTLVRLQEKPLRMSQPLYQRVLYALLLTYVPKAFTEHRIAVLRALPAPAQPRSTA